MASLLSRSPRREVSLNDRYDRADGVVLLSGVQALVRLIIEQRRLDTSRGLSTGGFVTGYPGSPLAGLDLELARRAAILGEWGVVHRPALNEELAATAIAGSQLSMLQPDRTTDGVVALWYAKAPGLDRASDALRHGNLMGTGPTGGVLVCVGDDPQAKSSSVPSSSEPSLFSLAMPFLSPADPQEVLDLGLHGYQLSRRSGLWVGMRIAASTADASQTVAVGPDRWPAAFTPFDLDGTPFVHQVSAHLIGAKLIELERSLYGARLDAARAYGAEQRLNRVSHRGEHDVIGLAAAGPTYLATMQALRKIGLGEEGLAAAGVRVLKVSMPYPLDHAVVRDFAAGLREVVVVEDKRGFLEGLVKEALYGWPDAPPVVGKRDERGRALVPAIGELDVDTIAAVVAQRVSLYRQVPALEAFATRAAPSAIPPSALVRGAYFCSGCPHNSSVRLPSGAFVGSGSGCHGLAIQMDPRQVGAVVGRFQMGGEGAMWNGMSPFVEADHFFQNIGDGTLAHSGSLAIRAAVDAGVNVTFKVLFNSTVAMTGGQRVVGGRPLADLTRLLQAEGVRAIIVTSDRPGRSAHRDLPTGVEVWDRSRLLEAQRRLAGTPGVTVLIHDQQCAAELRRERRRGTVATPRVHVRVNPLVCEDCGDCGAKSNCLSVRSAETWLGPRTRIHQESCNFDYSCLLGSCPALTTVRVARRHRRARTRGVPEDALPAPTPRYDVDGFTVRLAGVGGTGVLTASQVLAMAAHLQGLSVRTLDQTGIAQKGGTVVSDLRVSVAPSEGAPRLGEAECDLYLGCDPVVASDPKVLAVASHERTMAIVSSSMVPTGRQVADRTIDFPGFEALRSTIASRSRDDASLWLDALGLCHERLGSDAYANIMLLGAAYQAGGLVLEGEALEQAIRLNGVEVEENLRAFRLGRRLALDEPSRTLATPDETRPTVSERVRRVVDAAGLTVTDELREAVALRAADLCRFHDLAYARRYLAVVARASAAEHRLGVDDGAYTRAVVVQLHRLMAYKDEFEVARLLVDRRERAAIEREFGRGARVTYHLTPPWRRGGDGTSKVRLAFGATLALGTLGRARRLRGGPFARFGHRSERRLRDEYADRIDRLSGSLCASNLAPATELAGLPSMIRGYGALKARAIEEYEARLGQLESNH